MGIYRINSQDFKASKEIGNSNSEKLSTKEAVKVNIQESVGRVDESEACDSEHRHGWNVIVCQSLVDFDLPKTVPWRERLTGEKERVISFEDMVKDIVRFQDLWTSEKESLDENVVQDAQRKMLRNFIHHINVEEGIGTKNKKEIEEIMSKMEDKTEENDPTTVCVGLVTKKSVEDNMKTVDDNRLMPKNIDDRVKTDEEYELVAKRINEEKMKANEEDGLVMERVYNDNILPNLCLQSDKRKNIIQVRKRREETTLRTQCQKTKNRSVVEEANKENITPNLFNIQGNSSNSMANMEKENVPSNTHNTQPVPKRKTAVTERRSEINSTKTPCLQSPQPKRQTTKQLKGQFTRNNRETANLYMAWRKLDKMTETERELDPSNSGLLELKSYIVDIHRALMTGVIDDSTMTPPGVFSTCQRKATFKGKVHYYPTRESQEEWETELWTMLDRYNGLVHKVKKDMKSDRVKATACLFKCAAWLLFTLVSLHPFSDGNGRLCRLLASYSLSLIAPFPSSIYNIYSPSEKHDFLEALISARDSPSQHPVHLAALMVESNWSAWKEFLFHLGLQTSMEDQMGNRQHLMISKETDKLNCQHLPIAMENAWVSNPDLMTMEIIDEIISLD